MQRPIGLWGTRGPRCVPGSGAWHHLVMYSNALLPWHRQGATTVRMVIANGLSASRSVPGLLLRLGPWVAVAGSVRGLRAGACPR
jgi:hypothetical protein